MEIRERPYDIFSVIGVSTLLVIFILINEISGFEVQALRVILGLPFILFFPGYVLISALYPEKKRYFNSKGDPITKMEWDKLIEEREDEDASKDDLPDGKGLDNLERIALSLGLSIAITPLIGLVLNYTYDWSPDHLGIRLIPILISIYSFILITGVVATRRRIRTPVEDRFEIIVDIKVPEEYSIMDKALTIGIVVMMIASVSLLVYIIVVPREGEAFTEFYVLGPTGKAEKYPRNMLLEEEKFVIIGIGNHEHEKMNYTLVMTISSKASNNTMTSYEHVTVSRTNQPSMMVIVPDDGTVEIPCNFSILETGAYKLRFLLFRGEKEYRDLHLWIKVFEEGSFRISEDGGVDLYITDIEGDPSGLPRETLSGNPTGIGFGVRNRLNEQISVRISISLGFDGDPIEIDPDNRSIEVQNGKEYWIDVTINSTSSLDVLPMSFLFPDGEQVLRCLFEYDEETVLIFYYLNVGV